MPGKGGKRRKPETPTVEGFKRRWVLETTTEQNKAMQRLRDVLKWGEMALSRLNDTQKRPKAELLKRMQTALGYKGAIKERCEFLMACVNQSDGKDSKFDINRNLIHDLPSHAEKQFECAADFMLFGQTEETSSKSARSLLEAINIDNQLEMDGGMCLSKRIQEVLDKMQLSNSAASSSQHPHISAASCTPASATVPEQASAPPCAGHAPSQLQQALQIAQELITSDLHELNQQCTKLLETRNGTTPMEFEGEAAAGAASGKNKSPKTVRFAETPQSGNEEKDEVKACTPAESKIEDSACAASSGEARTGVGGCNTAEQVLALVKTLSCEEQEKFFAMCSGLSKAPGKQTVPGEPESAEVGLDSKITAIKHFLQSLADNGVVNKADGPKAFKIIEENTPKKNLTQIIKKICTAAGKARVPGMVRGSFRIQSFVEELKNIFGECNDVNDDDKSDDDDGESDDDGSASEPEDAG